MTTLVLGIGNTLLSDEGVGVHVSNYIRQHYTAVPDMECLDGGTLSFTLLGDIERSDELIVIDATQLNEAPGSFRTYVGDDMDRFLNFQTKRSVHEVSLVDLLSICRLADHLPARRALIGIQPQSLDWGESPSTELLAAIPAASEAAVKLIEEWHR